MRVYLAHNFAAREHLRDDIKWKLEEAGFDVTSSWIWDDSHIHSMNAVQSARRDLEDIDRADILVLFTDQWGEVPGKGKFTELGYAIAKGKAIFLCGVDYSSNVFYHLSNIYRVTKEELISGLQMVKSAKERI